MYSPSTELVSFCLEPFFRREMPFEDYKAYLHGDASHLNRLCEERGDEIVLAGVMKSQVRFPTLLELLELKRYVLIGYVKVMN